MMTRGRVTDPTPTSQTYTPSSRANAFTRGNLTIQEHKLTKTTHSKCKLIRVVKQIETNTPELEYKQIIGRPTVDYRQSK